MAIAALNGAADSQAVQFRIIERTGQTPDRPGDALLELPVQAKLTGGNLGGFNFDFAITGKSESNGSLYWASISNSDHKCFTSAPRAADSGIGTGGLASAYSDLAEVNGKFNGIINVPVGMFKDKPAECATGLIGGAVTGAAAPLGLRGLMATRRRR